MDGPDRDDWRLTVDRQYTSQKKFPIGFRNIRDRVDHPDTSTASAIAATVEVEMSGALGKGRRGVC
jgi:hypothetical protein